MKMAKLFLETLVSRLRQKPGTSRRPGPLPTAGEIEIENTAATEVTIECQISFWQYLDIRITDAAGNVVPAWHYGDCFSPPEKSFVVRLQPGEKVTHPVALLGNVSEDMKLTPGRYTIQAIYEYKTIRAVSNLLEIEINSADE
jgi:hypothetical protein